MAPYDPGGMIELAEEEEKEGRKSGKLLGSKRKFDEFDCPTCSANNPHDTFGTGEEVTCNWCGLSFAVKVDDDGMLKLREL